MKIIHQNKDMRRRRWASVAFKHCCVVTRRGIFVRRCRMVVDPSTFPTKYPNGNGSLLRLAVTICFFSFLNLDFSAHPGQQAIIVIDAMSLNSLVGRNEAEILCGGRHHRYFQLYGRLFSDLKAGDVKLVFFSDLNVQHQKMDEWLQRRSETYARTITLFDNIAKGMSVVDLLKTGANLRTLMVAMNALSTEARKHGEYVYVTQHECDVELAQYARDHNAMAVIGNDSDFLVYEGNWMYWSASNIDLETLATIEYSRTALCDYLSLSHQQLSLWATLVGNDITSVCFRDLRRFHTSLGTIEQKFLNVARYVRSFKRLPFSFDQHTIESIARRVFGDRNCRRMSPLIVDGIQSYNLDFPQSAGLSDPLLQKAVHHSGIYVKLMSDVHTLTLAMYDLRANDIVKTYTDVMAVVERRAIGVVWQERKSMQSQLTLAAKWSHEGAWCCRDMHPLYPPANRKSIAVSNQQENLTHTSIINISVQFQCVCRR